MTYIMLVSDSKLNLEWITIGNIDLKDKKLVHDIKTLGDSNPLGSGCVDSRTRIMKICCHLGRVWWQLNALIVETKNISFNLGVVVLEDFRTATAHREGLLGLGSLSSKKLKTLLVHAI